MEDDADRKEETTGKRVREISAYKRAIHEHVYRDGVRSKIVEGVEGNRVRRQHLWNRFSSGLKECFCSS